MLQDTGKRVAVEGFGNAVQQVEGIPIVTAAMAYDCPTTHHTYILIFHEALLIGGMKTHLLNPNQMRHQGIVVNDVPLQHLPLAERDLHCHSVICHEPPLNIPMSLRGIMSGFETRIPTAAELADREEKDVTWVHLTSSETWDPQAKSFSCLLYTSPSPRDLSTSRMPSSA